MSRINFLGVFACLLVLAGGCDPSSHQEATQKSKTDIVVILADDLGFSDLGCYGSEIHTPNLDSLAYGGVRFSNFYNNAKCSPSRAALLTGMYPHKAGIGRVVSLLGKPLKNGPYQGYLSDSTKTIAEWLKTAGYTTAMSGKWHIGERRQHWPKKRGFDRYFGLISGASSYYEVIKDQPRTRQMVLEDSLWSPPSDFYMTDAITDYAVDFIKDQDQADPYFIYLAYTAPHWPLHAPREDIEKYKGMYRGGWDSLRTSRLQGLIHEKILTGDQQLSPRLSSIPPWDSVEDKTFWTDRMEVHAAMIDRMDQGIGKIMQAIKARGNFENTLVVFLSDNGGSAENITGRGLNDPTVPVGDKGSYVAYREPWALASSTPWQRYKLWLNEGGISTPMVAHWPSYIKNKGDVLHYPAQLMDILPTLLDIEGITPTGTPGRWKSPDGVSLLPVFTGEMKERDSPIFWEYNHQKVVRANNWKILAYKDQPWRLFDLARDRIESRDLSGSHPELVDSLASLYTQWARSMNIPGQ